MNNKFESLKGNRFKTLSSNQLQKIVGGKGTGSGSVPNGVQFKRVRDQNGNVTTYERQVFMTFGKDEIDGGDTCYFDTGVGYGDWQVVK